MKLAERIKQRVFSSAQQEAILSVIVTGSWIIGELASVMAPHGITPSQYNVLRILRGSHPEMLTCGEVSSRLLDRTPDVTRMITRLKRLGLVDRARATHDRRIVEVWITEAGRSLLDVVDPEVDRKQAEIMGDLSEAENRELARLLEIIRT